MGHFLNPGNRNSFAEIVLHRYSGIFIDKTDFIGKTLELINRPTKFIAMTRPRRFGKTVMAQMLAAFYSCGCDSRELFKELKITRYKPKNEQQQNTAEAEKSDNADFHGSSEDLTCSEIKTVPESKIETAISSGREEQTGDRCCDNADHSMENHEAGNACGEAGAKEESLYEKYLNKSNVIYWDMNTVQAEFRNYLSEDEFYIRGIDDIVDYLQYATLSEIKKNEKFGKILAETPMIGKKNLFKAITTISEALDITFVLIMD